MPEVKLQHIVSVSSEDKHYPADNLLKGDGFKKWKCVAGEKQASIVLQFEKSVEVKQIDIGNEGSAFIEILVGKSTATEDDYQVILVASSFMSPNEARANQNPNRVRIFNADQLSQAVINQKWDRAKIVCTQPFNKLSQYGLSFIKFHSTQASDSSNSSSGATSKADAKPEFSLGAFKIRSEDDSNLIHKGSIFEKIKTKSESLSPVTGAAAIRAASKLAEESGSKHAVSSTYQQPFTTTEASRRHTEKEIADKASGSKEAAEETKRKSTQANKDKEPLKEDKDSSAASPPPAKKIRSDKVKAHKSQPLMSGVVFTISGIQNPERSDLRDAALKMGALYKPDWIKGCTHLVCAFEGTPKYEQVSGHGYIVKKSWINDCYAQKTRLPWRKYRLGRAPTPTGHSSDNDDTDEDEPIAAAIVEMEKKKSDVEVVASRSASTASAASKDNDSTQPLQSSLQTDADKTEEEWDPFADDIGIASDCDTEEEIRRFEEMNSNKPSASATEAKSSKTSAASVCLPSTSKKEESSTEQGSQLDTAMSNGKDVDELPELPNHFSGKTFLLYGKVSDRRSVLRYIVAYDGRIADYMGEDVKYVITDSEWDDSFDEALSENPNIAFIRSAWIISSHEAQKCLPHQKFAVVSA